MGKTSSLHSWKGLILMAAWNCNDKGLIYFPRPSNLLNALWVIKWKSGRICLNNISRRIQGVKPINNDPNRNGGSPNKSGGDK